MAIFFVIILFTKCKQYEILFVWFRIKSNLAHHVDKHPFLQLVGMKNR